MYADVKTHALPKNISENNSGQNSTKNGQTRWNHWLFDSFDLLPLLFIKTFTFWLKDYLSLIFLKIIVVKNQQKRDKRSRWNHWLFVNFDLLPIFFKTFLKAFGWCWHFAPSIHPWIWGRFWLRDYLLFRPTTWLSEKEGSKSLGCKVVVATSTSLAPSFNSN